MLLAHPEVAFLDEATTAIDPVSEEALYKLLSNVTNAYLSIGYRANLARYHHTHIELLGDGLWRMEKLS